MNVTKNNVKHLVLQELENITFPKCRTRANIKGKESTTSFVLGEVNYRGQKNLQGRTRGPSVWNAKYAKLYDLVQQLILLHKPNFKYTTVQVNKNVECQPHIDKNNVGESYIIALGDYVGGDLIIEGKHYNIRNRWKKFDGHRAHWVEPFERDRYTLVFFTHTFKPPNRSLTNLSITKNGIYKKNGEIIREF